jgi:hypothetical protein
MNRLSIAVDPENVCDTPIGFSNKYFTYNEKAIRLSEKRK